MLASGTAFYNVATGPVGSDEMSGCSVFCKDECGDIFHTYSTTARRRRDVPQCLMRHWTLPREARNEHAPLDPNIASHPMMQPGLPPENVYLPFEPGPYRLAMGLTSVPDAAWFELDEHYPAQMQERTRLLLHRHDEVFAAQPVSNAARSETLDQVIANLVNYHPAWFTCTGDALHCRLTGETWNRAQPPCDPLEVAGRLVQEDLCIVQQIDGIPVLTAAVLCFPSRWSLAEKLGRPLAEVHAPVPLYAERLAQPVDRFMQHVKEGHIAVRLNWSVLDESSLFQPTGKWRDAHNPGVTADNAGTTLFLRVERQTLRRLPRSDAVLFGIRVHVYPLAAVIGTRACATRLAAAVRVLPDATQRYKSLLPIRAALLGWLDARAA